MISFLQARILQIFLLYKINNDRSIQTNSGNRIYFFYVSVPIFPDELVYYGFAGINQKGTVAGIASQIRNRNIFQSAPLINTIMRSFGGMKAMLFVNDVSVGLKHFDNGINFLLACFVRGCFNHYTDEGFGA